LQRSKTASYSCEARAEDHARRKLLRDSWAVSPSQQTSAGQAGDLDDAGGAAQGIEHLGWHRAISIVAASTSKASRWSVSQTTSPPSSDGRGTNRPPWSVTRSANASRE